MGKGAKGGVGLIGQKVRTTIFGGPVITKLMRRVYESGSHGLTVMSAKE